MVMFLIIFSPTPLQHKMQKKNALGCHMELITNWPPKIIHPHLASFLFSTMPKMKLLGSTCKSSTCGCIETLLRLPSACWLVPQLLSLPELLLQLGCHPSLASSLPNSSPNLPDKGPSMVLPRPSTDLPPPSADLAGPSLDLLLWRLSVWLILSINSALSESMYSARRRSLSDSGRSWYFDWLSVLNIVGNYDRWWWWGWWCGWSSLLRWGGAVVKMIVKKKNNNLGRLLLRASSHSSPGSIIYKSKKITLSPPLPTFSSVIIITKKYSA